MRYLLLVSGPAAVSEAGFAVSPLFDELAGPRSGNTGRAVVCAIYPHISCFDTLRAYGYT